MATDKWLHGQMATRQMTTGQMGTWINGYMDK